MSEQNPLGPEGSYYDHQKEQAEATARRKEDGIYPVFVTGLYLVLGFVFHLWHPGWLIFLTIPLHYMKPKTQLERWCNPVMITLIYLVMGFFFHLWHPGWLIFLAIPAAAIADHAEKK